MLLEPGPVRVEESLQDLVERLDVNDPATSFGKDIDAANAILHDPAATLGEKEKVFREWLAREVPCLFARLGAKEMRHIGFDICWLDEHDIRLGDVYLSSKMQRARRIWKDRAATGFSHGLVIVFNSLRLSLAKPGPTLIEVSRRIAELYLIEHTPITTDVIYTEAIPLIRDGGYELFKAGINIFYPSAHRTRNHDRRIPGGMAISINSPGHFANSLVTRGHAASLEDAVAVIMDLAMRSIGNGGIGHPNHVSSSWHNRDPGTDKKASRCPVKHVPSYIPKDASTHFYSAAYHTDVLIPKDVMSDNALDPDIHAQEIWSWLVIDYITERLYPPDHINYGLFHGHPIPAVARYHNPWPPRIAVNSRPSS